ncbi:MAG: hypothetical protein LQ350_006072 [Teloschistes chrysophthalmus]|nr:MAG: hypothetical protein LQ350_006072 [Niorma chrysophthalma]
MPPEPEFEIDMKSKQSSSKNPALPLEILEQIASYVNVLESEDGSWLVRQRGLWAMTLVSRTWYAAAITKLYHSPGIRGKNFQLFVRTLCPSINPHIRKTDFSSMIKVLNMSYLVHDGSKSLTSRILGRVKDGLEVFIAPQASFAVNCLAALSKCLHLRKLDLSFVAQTVSTRQLLNSTSKCSQLEWLSIKCDDGTSEDKSNPSLFDWPPNLKTLVVSGPLGDETMIRFGILPKSVTDLTFSQCPKISKIAVFWLLKDTGQLESLTIGRRTTNVDCAWLIDWLWALPKLRRLNFTLSDRDSIAQMVHGALAKPPEDHPYRLQQLELDLIYLDNPWLDLDDDELWDAIDEGHLSCLRRLVFTHRSGTRPPKAIRRYVRDLDDLLKALAREDGERATIDEDEAGAFICKR